MNYDVTYASQTDPDKVVWVKFNAIYIQLLVKLCLEMKPLGRVEIWRSERLILRPNFAILDHF